MNVRRTAWLGVSSVALASWFASASTTDVRAPVGPLPPSRPLAMERSLAALQSDVDRLHDRLGPTAAPTRSRDLFHFSTPIPKSAAAPRPSPPAVVADAPPAAPRPVFRLIGVAEDTTADGTLVRTAIVAGASDLFLVKVGETVADRFRVEQVSSDAVELIDTTTSAATTLALR
jgi:hypothetical protein